MPKVPIGLLIFYRARDGSVIRCAPDLLSYEI